jgi:hypothetical protein
MRRRWTPRCAALCCGAAAALACAHFTGAEGTQNEALTRVARALAAAGTVATVTIAADIDRRQEVRAAAAALAARASNGSATGGQVTHRGAVPRRTAPEVRLRLSQRVALPAPRRYTPSRRTLRVLLAARLDIVTQLHLDLHPSAIAAVAEHVASLPALRALTIEAVRALTVEALPLVREMLPNDGYVMLPAPNSPFGFKAVWVHDDAPALRLVASLPWAKRLEAFDVTWAFLSADTWRAVCASLPWSLRSLRVSVGPHCALPNYNVVGALDRLPELRSLALKPGRALEFDWLQVIASCLQQLPALRELDLSEAEVRSRDVELLAAMAARVAHLTKLSLGTIVCVDGLYDNPLKVSAMRSVRTLRQHVAVVQASCSWGDKNECADMSCAI